MDDGDVGGSSSSGKYKVDPRNEEEVMVIGEGGSSIRAQMQPRKVLITSNSAITEANEEDEEEKRNTFALKNTRTTVLNLQDIALVQSHNAFNVSLMDPSDLLR